MLSSGVGVGMRGLRFPRSPVYGALEGLVILFVLILGTTKLVMTSRGYSIVPTLLDWVIDVLYAAT